MATVQYERDLRSTQKASKRRKDSAVKWSYGVRPLPGTLDFSVDGKARPVLKGSPSWTPRCSHSAIDPATARERFEIAEQARRERQEVLEFNEEVLAFAEQGYTVPGVRWTSPYERSVAKQSRKKTAASKLPSGRVPAEMDVDAACSEIDLIGSPRRRDGQGTVLSIPAEASETAIAAARGILSYGSDATDAPAPAPAPALSLDAFAKPNARATEKLVKKEYEVLDTNGDAVTGRKARQVLRQETSVAAPATPATPTPLDDEDFELV